MKEKRDNGEIGQYKRWAIHEKKFLERDYKRRRTENENEKYTRLTKAKSLEVEELLKEKKDECFLLCLIEKEQKYQKVNFSQGTMCVEKIRDE